ncbi:MAG TPA: GNAT family N-acetyltransferase, partial [Candidatus Cybelea sp.]|jgi:GNAT superfamily N-acetyltransferase|nr:GNAT family N-acetyltransferase [Candidatus Cybelea sp.]
VNVRAARPEDAQQIARLTLQLGYDVRQEVIAESLRRRGSREVFVAATGERIVGWTAVSMHEPFVEGPGAHLDGLVVDESVRSSGIGGKLLAAAEAWARERDCKEMCLHSNVVRDRAHAFYRRHGYDTVKAQYYFRKLL